jgi:hypothetical protein
MHVTVQESEEKKALNTPGGDELAARWGGGKAGLPFIAFADGKGELIVNSLRVPEDGTKGGNIGHPWEPHEVDWFLFMLRKAAPKMTPGETATIEKWLRAQKKPA